MSQMRRILQPSDFSPASNAAFAKAVEMAKANRAELLLVHVQSPFAPVAGGGYVSPQVYAEIEASAKAYAQKQLAALAARAKKGGGARQRAPAGGFATRADRAGRAVEASRPRGPRHPWPYGPGQDVPRQRGRPGHCDRDVSGDDDPRQVRGPLPLVGDKDVSI
jgi:nucleotide-binding universal stress UspA family protein